MFNKEKAIQIAKITAIVGAGAVIATQTGMTLADYVEFSGWVLKPTPEGVEAGTSAVEKWIGSAFGIIAFLSILALAMGWKFILNFLVSLPWKVFWWTGGSK